MTVANLLDTSTKNFQDLVGNGRSYQVPKYQRDYSWKEEHWEDLWEDIKELRESPNNRHYMGAVVVKAETDRDFLIIDGQQRIATLSILGLAVIDRLKKLAAENEEQENNQRAEALRAAYIGAKDPATLVEISKLSLNEIDNGFFKDYLVQLRIPANPRSLPKSNRLLWECFQFFQKKIAEDDSLTTGLAIAELLSEIVARRLLFILITVEDEISAYTVFETLNARGLELTTTDLLKNYLFSRVNSAADLESLQRRWHRLILTVKQERFGEFIRYHYLTKRRQIRSGKLFKIVRDEVKSAKDVLELMDILESRAELFDAMGDPNHGFWLDYPDSKTYVRQLALFRVRQMMPLLFAAYERFNPDDFVRVLKLLTAVSFRYTIVGGLNPNELEPIYHDAAKSVLAGQAKTASAVFDQIKSIYVPDSKFEADFAQRTFATAGTRRRITKYVLCKLESDAVDRIIDFETDPATIEHILPENPADAWEESIEREKWPDFVYRLGNLTLLSAAYNRRVANMTFPDKLETYAASGYALSRRIADDGGEEWSVARIEKRQTELAKRAAHIWRSDFA